MSFNATVPLAVRDLEKRIDKINYDIRKKQEELRKTVHECDCEFCEIEEEAAFLEDEEIIGDEIKELEADLPLVKDTLKRLKQYAKDKGIELPKGY